MNKALGSLILVCAGALPGYWISVLTVDTLGRKTIQITGFFILTIIFCIIGFAYESLTSGPLLALYILAQVFFNFGPNATTFLVPGECFPTRYRATGHGISAAGGKIGAIVAQVMAHPLLTKGATPDCVGHACQPWVNRLMQVFALFMLCGTFTSFLIPETKGRTLEELAGEGTPDYMNGGVNPDNEPKGWWQRNSPFGGGKPAGFSTMRSPSILARSPGMKGKKERVGIMTSPEMMPKKGEKRKKSHAKAESFESGGDPLRHSASSNGRHQSDDHDDAYITRSSGGVFPGWGTGWGVQRGSSREGAGDNIMLHDVGSLLK